MKNGRSFSLRSLILIITLVAVLLGLWARARHFRQRAATHHIAAMDFGYEAAAIQRPVDPQWEWKYPSEIRMDRASIVEAAPFWQRSLYHARVRDIYLSAAGRPWMPLPEIPAIPDPVSVPKLEVLLEGWWKATFGGYVDDNPCLLEAAMGFPAGDRNLAIAQDLLSDEQFSGLANRFRQRRRNQQEFEQFQPGN